MDVHGAAERAALWDAWEQVEGRSTEQIRELYRAARREHGLEASDAVVIPMSLVLTGGGSWTGAEIRDGAHDVRERLAVGYREARGRRAVTKPLREEIRRQVAAGAAGKAREQLRAELSAAYAARGLEPPTAPQLGAEAVRISRPSWRDGLLAVRDRRAFVESVMGLSYPSKREPTAPRLQPEWACPPEGATQIPAGRKVAVRVELTGDGREVLFRLIDEWRPEAADHQPVCWLTVGTASDDPVAVHLGETEVGELGTHASDRCREPVAAAQAAQRWLRDTALLTGGGSAGHPHLLRLRIPLLPADPDPG